MKIELFRKRSGNSFVPNAKFLALFESEKQSTGLKYIPAGNNSLSALFARNEYKEAGVRNRIDVGIISQFLCFVAFSGSA